MPDTTPAAPGAALVRAVRAALAEAADPARATGQQAYMKSAMPFRGLTSPVLRATLRPLLADPAHRLADRAEWEAAVRCLWDDAAYREERYAALALAGHRTYRAWAREVASVPLFRHLVVTGAWWDVVDEIASHRIGDVLRAHPDTEADRMRQWARDPDLWVRRTAILSQLSSKDQLDRQLLVDVIEPNLADREFFIRKAIGWALRQHAHLDPEAGDWVREVVAAWGDRMAPLSRREALKNL
ncbi:MAG: DNA alkylation repair protein [Oryzihumus sp.]